MTNTDHLCIVENDKLFIYSKEKLIFEKSVVKSKTVYVNIRNKNVYILDDGIITGYYLQLYLSVLEDFHCTEFVNTENEIILFDSEQKEIGLYQKNLENLLFQCKADEFSYCDVEKRLYNVYKGCSLFIIK